MTLYHRQEIFMFGKELTNSYIRNPLGFHYNLQEVNFAVLQLLILTVVKIISPRHLPVRISIGDMQNKTVRQIPYTIPLVRHYFNLTITGQVNVLHMFGIYGIVWRHVYSKLSCSKTLLTLHCSLLPKDSESENLAYKLRMKISFFSRPQTAGLGMPLTMYSISYFESLMLSKNILFVLINSRHFQLVKLSLVRFP